MSTGSIGTPPSSSAPAAPAPASTAGAAGGFSLDDIRALAQILREFELGDLELARASGERLRLRARQSEVVSTVSVPATRPAAAPAQSGPPAEPSPTPSKAKEAADPSIAVVSAPLVGTVYRSSSPDAPPFVEVGQRVKKGQTLCIIEAMKLMNELESEVAGVVVRILAENGRPVEYGEPLFHIKVGG